MAEIKDFREALVARIQAAVPDTEAIPRNILSITDDGQANLLLADPDLAGKERVRGWMVTLAAGDIHEVGQHYTEYNLVFAVWQFQEYFTGSNTENSEDLFDADLFAVLREMGDRQSLPVILRGSEGLAFSTRDLFPGNVQSGMLHVGKGEWRTRWKSNC